MSSFESRPTCPISGGACRNDCALYDGYQHDKCGLARIELQAADICKRMDAIGETLKKLREVTR